MCDLVGRVPHDQDLVICGDFNARTGQLTPGITHAHSAQRSSSDTATCARGKWLIEHLGIWQRALLNGTFADLEGRATCHRHNGTSVVDYIGVRGSPTQFEVVQHAFEGLSDHSPLLCTIRAPPVRMQSKQHSHQQHDATYKWIGGSSLDDYCTSWQA